jgi:elongator complex protein 1
MKMLEYAFFTLRGTTLPPDDFGMTAVIDGQTLKVTPLRLANVPPPMALIEIPLKHKAVDVAFNPSASMVAVLHRDAISVFKLNRRQGQFQDPVLANFFPLDIDLNDESVQQIAFTASSSLAYLQSSTASGSIICGLDCGQSSCSSTKRLFIEPQGILRLLASQGHEGLCFETTSGKVTQVSSGAQDFQMSNAIVTLPSQMPWIEVVNTGGEYVAFSLSRGGSLFANSRLLAKNCTSFLVTPAHLIFTTTLHLLKFVHICSVEGKHRST